MTFSESKATTLQSKLSKLELKADPFSRDTPLPGLASLTVFTAFQISEPDLLYHRHSLNELRYGLELSISFFHPCHLPNEIDWYPAWHRLNANYIQVSPSGGPQDIVTKLTLSSLALSIYRTNYYDPKTFPIHIPNRNEDTFLRRGYYGGHADAHIPKGQNIYFYDVNSLYPFIMKTFPIPGGKPVWHGKLEGQDLDNLYGFIDAYVDLVTPCALRLLASKPKTERKGGIELKDRLRAEKDRRDKEANKGEKGDQNRGNGWTNGRPNSIYLAGSGAFHRFDLGRIAFSYSCFFPLLVDRVAPSDNCLPKKGRAESPSTRKRKRSIQWTPGEE